MAIKKVQLPNNTVVDINDPRISGVDSTPTSGSANVVTSGGIYSEVVKVVYIGDQLGSATISGDDGDDGDTSNFVTQVNVGNTAYIPSFGVISLPTYPTVPTISTSISSDASSNTKTASPKSVKDYVDGIVGDIETLINAL